VRCYVINIEGGKPIPVTPEGVTGGYVSPDSKNMLANNGQVVSLDSPRSESMRQIPGLERDFALLQWSADGTAVYGYHPGEVPAKVVKVDINTGRKTFIQDLQPETTTGVVTIAPAVVNRDASRFAFSYYQVLSGLYVVSGLR
jgi:hypothetical protein